MIISASRRTDIPAFYSEWFFNRIKEGYVLVRNPMNPHQLRKIALSPNLVDCFVFWTKNPAPMIPRLEELKSYSYYFQYTLTPYGTSVEPNIPGVATRVKTFQELSKRIGAERVIWRYDPIIISETMDSDWHCQQFESLCHELKGYSPKCVVSFVDFYRKCVNNLNALGARLARADEMMELLKVFNSIAAKSNFKIETCSEKIQMQGVSPSKCIDDCLVCKISGRNKVFKKDKMQRLECGCVESYDIGAYNTCNHRCLYCYANAQGDLIDRNRQKHNPLSPVLIGNVAKDDKITEVKSGPFETENNQTLLF